MWQNIIQCIRRRLNFSKLNRKTGLRLVVPELAIDEAERLSTGFPGSKLIEIVLGAKVVQN
jgi:hypothetical protein